MSENNKTCGDCRYFENGECCFFHNTLVCTKSMHPLKTKPTLGDKIRKMSNEGIAAFVCGVLNDRREETFRSVLDLLNAPAESEGEDE